MNSGLCRVSWKSPKSVLCFLFPCLWNWHFLNPHVPTQIPPADFVGAGSDSGFSVTVSVCWCRENPALMDDRVTLVVKTCCWSWLGAQLHFWEYIFIVKILLILKLLLTYFMGLGSIREDKMCFYDCVWWSNLSESLLNERHILTFHRISIGDQNSFL